MGPLAVFNHANERNIVFIDKYSLVISARVDLDRVACLGLGNGSLNRLALFDF